MIASLAFCLLLFFSPIFGMKKFNVPKLKIVPSPGQQLFGTEPICSMRNPLHSGPAADDEESYEDEIHSVCALDAAYDCDLQLLQSLVTESNVNKVGRIGNPIIFATIQKSFDDLNAPVEPVFDFLVDKGVCVDTIERGQQMSAFEHATRLSARSPQKNLKTLIYFLKIGASPFFAPPEKKCAFDIALGFAMENDKKTFPQAREVLKLFQDQARTLDQAVKAFNPELVTKFANATNVQEFNDERKKPLYTAISCFNNYNSRPMLQIIRTLLKAGADPNEGVKNMVQAGNTHLMVATIVSIMRGNTEMIPVLLEAGGNPHMKLIPTFSPSAYDIAYEASRLSTKAIEKQSRLGYSKEISTVAKNQKVAETILWFFEKHKPQK